MKKDGTLHAQLMREIAALGHFDSFVICDMGFPIPKGPVVVDLALTRGVPTVRQVLAAVLQEAVVQQAVLVDKIAEANPLLQQHIKEILCKQEIAYTTFNDFRAQAAEAKFIIRTGEDAPCSNILLVSASGVLERVEQYNI